MISVSDNGLALSGALTMDTVPALYAQGLPYLQQKNMRVNFAKVEIVDSSAVSLLLAWLRVAQQSQCDFQVANLPSSLQSLAGLYGVSDLLPPQAI